MPFHAHDTEFGGFHTGDRVKIAKLVDPRSMEARSLFGGVVDEALAGRAQDAEGVISFWLLPVDSNRPEPLPVVTYDRAGAAGWSLATYAVREMVHLDLVVEVRDPQ